MSFKCKQVTRGNKETGKQALYYDCANFRAMALCQIPQYIENPSLSSTLVYIAVASPISITKYAIL